MKYQFLIALLIILNVEGQGNPAMPGIWNAGVGGQFFPLFAQDSTHFGKIRMEKELILVNLYPGFAVVKGEYTFSNTTSSAVRMHLGYPINGTYTSAVVDHVIYNDLYAFQVHANGLPVRAARLKDSGDLGPVRISGNDSARNEAYNWYLWEQDFPPNQSVTLTVYFITQNNLARLKQGMQSRDGNAFGYTLESGRAWGGHIGIGQVLIKLNEGLTLTNVMGILPGKGIIGDLTHIQYSFQQIEPGPEDNLLIWYQGAPPDFKFDKRVLPAADTLFRMIDDFPVHEFNQPYFTEQERQNFSTSLTGLTFSGILYFLMFTVPWLILGAIVIFLIKGKKKSTNEPPSNA